MANNLNFRYWVVLFRFLIIYSFNVQSTALAATRLRNITVDDQNSSIHYAPPGAWNKTKSTSLDFGGSHMLTEEPCGTASFNFTGIAIYFMSPLWPYTVNTEISLDSGPSTLVDLVDYSRPRTNGGPETVKYHVVWKATGLANTHHHLRISVGVNQSYAIVDGLIYTEVTDVESSLSTTSTLRAASTSTFPSSTIASSTSTFSSSTIASPTFTLPSPTIASSTSAFTSSTIASSTSIFSSSTIASSTSTFSSSTIASSTSTFPSSIIPSSSTFPSSITASSSSTFSYSTIASPPPSDPPSPTAHPSGSKYKNLILGIAGAAIPVIVIVVGGLYYMGRRKKPAEVIPLSSRRPHWTIEGSNTSLVSPELEHGRDQEVDFTSPSARLLQPEYGRNQAVDFTSPSARLFQPEYGRDQAVDFTYRSPRLLQPGLEAVELSARD